MSQASVDDIVLGEQDSNNRVILDVYARQSYRYAVYQTEGRVVIAYSDDPLVQKIQRKRLAGLAVLRSEIDGMLAPWREKSQRYSRLSVTALQFDMRVASALIEALEDETEAARAILQRIKDDVAGEMASRARLSYVFWSIISALAVLGACLLIHSIAGHFFADSLIPEIDRRHLLAAMCTGVLGALYSIAMRIEQRGLKDDIRRLDSFTDSFVRLGLGAMGAFILGSFLISGAIEIHFGTGINPGSDGKSGPNFIYLVLIAGFLAGFVERLVPDLLNSYAVVARKDAPIPPPQTPPVPPPSPAAGLSTSPQDIPPDNEDSLAAPPSDGDELDGCSVHAEDPADVTPDEELPAASGGVER